MNQRLKFSDYAQAMEYIAKHPGVVKSVVARSHGLEPHLLLDAITLWFGGLSGLTEESFKAVAEREKKGTADPTMLATERSLKKSPPPPAPAPAPAAKPDRRPARPAAPPVPFKAAPGLPDDLVDLEPPGASGTRGYDAIFRADAVKPELVIPRTIAAKIAMIQSVSPSDTLKSMRVDLQFSPSTHKIVIRKRTTPGGFSLRCGHRGVWTICSLKLRAAPVPRKYILKIEANRSDHLLLAPVDIKKLAAS